MQCWAPSLFAGNKPLKTRPVVLRKIYLHWPHANLIEVIGNVSHDFKELWKGLMPAGVQFLVVKPACREAESSATNNWSSNIRSRIWNPHLFGWRLPQGDAKSLLPLHPLPPAPSPARIWIKPWRELSVRDDFPVIIAWVRDYALFFCKLPYLQSRTHWAHVQLIHSSSNSRSNYRVRCKFNYSTCRKQKWNLIVKFVLLHWKDKKKKKKRMLKWPVWAEYISLPRAEEKWTLFLMQKLHWMELFFFFLFFFFPLPYSALRWAAETSSSYACTCATPSSFWGSVWGPLCSPSEVVSWDENQASWTSDKGTSRSKWRQMVLLKGFVPLGLARLKLLWGPL